MSSRSVQNNVRMALAKRKPASRINRGLRILTTIPLCGTDCPLAPNLRTSSRDLDRVWVGPQISDRRYKHVARTGTGHRLSPTPQWMPALGSGTPESTYKKSRCRDCICVSRPLQDRTWVRERKLERSSGGAWAKRGGAQDLGMSGLICRAPFCAGTISFLGRERLLRIDWPINVFLFLASTLSLLFGLTFLQHLAPIFLECILVFRQSFLVGLNTCQWEGVVKNGSAHRPARVSHPHGGKTRRDHLHVLNSWPLAALVLASAVPQICRSVRDRKRGAK